MQCDWLRTTNSRKNSYWFKDKIREKIGCNTSKAGATVGKYWFKVVYATVMGGNIDAWWLLLLLVLLIILSWYHQSGEGGGEDQPEVWDSHPWQVWRWDWRRHHHPSSYHPSCHPSYFPYSCSSCLLWDNTDWEMVIGCCAHVLWTRRTILGLLVFLLLNIHTCDTHSLSLTHLIFLLIIVLLVYNEVQYDSTWPGHLNLVSFHPSYHHSWEYLHPSSACPSVKCMSHHTMTCDTVSPCHPSYLQSSCHPPSYLQPSSLPVCKCECGIL